MRISVVFPSPEGPTSATISPGAASKPEPLIIFVPAVYEKSIFSSFSAYAPPWGCSPPRGSLLSSASSLMRRAATELVMAEGSMPTRPENALLRLARCWRNSVIVPKFIYPPHSRHRQYAKAMNSTSFPSAESHAFVRMLNELYPSATSLYFPCQPRRRSFVSSSASKPFIVSIL